MVLAGSWSGTDEYLPGTIYLDPGPCLLCSGELYGGILVRREGLAEGISLSPDIGDQYSRMCI